ncbi:7-cyano-7-deazaguanine synthase QueC [Seleniivibrio woodruffii]|uniref:7-cyano-7-deazaguanine synthase QueC n=1 Tax=Seleniivibrio woodruffii TaxID=1078050 RepID=UPI0026F1C270|nr:7-cyano-7-deazaguanine synthase QueC [Seleniivibrio woodruffii]
MRNNSAMVVFSGGQDSTTCLGWALRKFEKVHTITFSYGQNHSIELVQAEKIAEKMGVSHRIVDISFFAGLVDSALTTKGADVSERHPRLKNLPASYVPNRNALFLTLSHAYAQLKGCDNLVAGVCETDFSGYPDCRMVFVQAQERALNLGSETELMIHTPLMYLNKAETFKLAKDCGVLDMVLEDSHTCYEGDRTVRHQWGYGCGGCPACKLRAKGYEDYLKL